MRLLFPVLLATLVLGCTTPADDKHHPPEPAAVAGEQRLAGAHEQMKKMMAQMDKIKSTKNPGERAHLMQEHMDSMHEGVLAMHPSGGAMHGPKSPTERMEMMEKRMDMMQMMMEQMVEREGQKTVPKQD